MMNEWDIRYMNEWWNEVLSYQITNNMFYRGAYNEDFLIEPSLLPHSKQLQKIRDCDVCRARARDAGAPAYTWIKSTYEYIYNLNLYV